MSQEKVDRYKEPQSDPGKEEKRNLHRKDLRGRYRPCAGMLDRLFRSGQLLGQREQPPGDGRCKRPGRLHDVSGNRISESSTGRRKSPFWTGGFQAAFREGVFLFQRKRAGGWPASGNLIFWQRSPL